MHKYFNDNWTIDDDFGIAKVGDRLAEIALQANPPFSIKVTGKWGTGKTSILNRAFATLKGNPISQAVPLGNDMPETDLTSWNQWGYDRNIERGLNWDDHLVETADKSMCVWFSPWQHQGAENPLIPLLLEIKEQFRFRIRLINNIKRKTRSAALASIALIERCIDAYASFLSRRGIKITQGTMKDVREAWKSGYDQLTELNIRQRFHLLFEDAVKQTLSTLPHKNEDRKTLDNARLVIFIDDLDRCEESMIVNLLESIKLYLSTPYCVFILGVDDNAVLNALKHHWNNRSDDDNREYLEKMFQVTITVPQPKIEKVQEAISMQLKAHGIDPTLSDQCAHEMIQLIEPNPRKVKNYCNSFCAAWQLYDYPDDSLDKETLTRFLLFHYLRIFHTPVWRLLERQPDMLKLLHYVLVGAKEVPEIDGMDDDESSIVIEFFYRSFVHVLGKLPDDEKRIYRNMEIEQAVELFEQRIDRKKSDQYFKQLIKSYIDKDDILDDAYLCLSTISKVNQSVNQ